MKDFYTIGETAAMLGVSTDTLRYYDKIGLLKPAKVDSENKYRYYSYTQFHYIDRIKYLQYLGLSLEEIGKILHTGRVDDLLVYLKAERVNLRQELVRVQQKMRDIDWYIRYFTYMDQRKGNELLYKVRLPRRYILKCPCFPKESLAAMEVRLAQKKSSAPYLKLEYNRQYGYILDADAVFRQHFVPKSYFIFFSSRPPLPPAEYDVLPAGEYLCFRSRALRESWDMEQLKAYFSQMERPKLVLALKFEDNLREHQDAWYELEMLVNEETDEDGESPGESNSN